MATFYNQATLSYSRGTVSSNITSGELVEVLSVTKTAVVGEYGQDSEITYAVNITNAGTSSYTDLTVTDDLGAYTYGEMTLQPEDYIDNSAKYFIDGVLQATPAVTAGPPLVISGLSVPAGSIGTLLYTVGINGYAPMSTGGSITNTATVSGEGTAGVSASETINVSAGAELAITKSVSPSTVTDNSRLTYTFVIQNTGNTEATADDEIVVSDTFSPVLSDIAVTYNGAAWTSPGDYSYDEESGEFATTAGAITVPAATYSQDPTTGAWAITPGTVVLTVTGTI